MGQIGSICSWICCCCCRGGDGDEDEKEPKPEFGLEEGRSLKPSHIPDKFLTTEYKVPSKKFLTLEDVFIHEGYDWSTKKMIGKGGYATAYKVTRIIDKVPVVVKEIELKAKYKKVKELKNEIYIFRNIKHKNIISFIGDFIVNNTCYLVMELANGGSLEEEIKRNGPLDELTAKAYFIQICRAIERLHCQTPPVAHLDIKPANVLIHVVDGHKIIKVTDFGLSLVIRQRHTKADQPKSWTRTRTPKGTMDYMSPQLIRLILWYNLMGDKELKALGKVKSVNPIKADIWALGVTLYQMITTTEPFDTFEKDDKRLLYTTVAKQEKRRIKPIKEEISSELRDLLYAMLNPITRTRITITQILKHKWLFNASEDIPTYSSNN